MCWIAPTFKKTWSELPRVYGRVIWYRVSDFKHGAVGFRVSISLLQYIHGPLQHNTLAHFGEFFFADFCAGNSYSVMIFTEICVWLKSQENMIDIFIVNFWKNIVKSIICAVNIVQTLLVWKVKGVKFQENMFSVDAG